MLLRCYQLMIWDWAGRFLNYLLLVMVSQIVCFWYDSISDVTLIGFWDCCLGSFLLEKLFLSSLELMKEENELVFLLIEIGEIGCEPVVYLFASLLAAGSVFVVEFSVV